MPTLGPRRGVRKLVTARGNKCARDKEDEDEAVLSMGDEMIKDINRTTKNILQLFVEIIKTNRWGDV